MKRTKLRNLGGVGGHGRGGDLRAGDLYGDAWTTKTDTRCGVCRFAGGDGRCFALDAVRCVKNSITRARQTVKRRRCRKFYIHADSLQPATYRHISQHRDNKNGGVLRVMYSFHTCVTCRFVLYS